MFKYLFLLFLIGVVSLGFIFFFVNQYAPVYRLAGY